MSILRFKYIRKEEDFYDETNETYREALIGYTLGCSCCVIKEEITEENLKEQIDSLRAELNFCRDLLQTKFQVFNDNKV